MFECGTLKCHVENIKMNQGLGEEYEIPVPWFLVEHPRGLVVIDGGNAAQCADDPVGHWGGISDVYWPEMTARAGVRAGDEGRRLRPRRRRVHPAVAPAPRPHRRARRDRPVPQRPGDRHPRRVRVRVRAGLVRGRRLHPGRLQQARRPLGAAREHRGRLRRVRRRRDPLLAHAGARPRATSPSRSRCPIRARSC